MKCPLLVAAAVSVAVLSSSCAFQRIGDLTVVSNRNTGHTGARGEYELLRRDVEATARARQDDALEQAIDEATAEVPGGEYLENVKVYVKSNGKKVRVRADVWGIPQAGPVDVNVTSSVTVDNTIAPGDAVTFKRNGIIWEGVIQGVNAEAAVVKYTNKAGRELRHEVAFAKLTKVHAGATTARGDR